MDKIINAIKQVITSPDVSFIAIGLLFIVFGVLAGVFKQYWFIAGVNCTSKKELAKMDLNYLCKYFGIFMCALGLFIVLSTFSYEYFSLKYEWRAFIFMTVLLSFCIFMIWFFNVKKKSRIYKKDERNYSKC